MDGDSGAPALGVETEDLIRRISTEHEWMRDDLTMFRDARHLPASGDRAAAWASLGRTDRFLHQMLLPHAHAEDRKLYPALAGPLGSPEATAMISRMHP